MPTLHHLSPNFSCFSCFLSMLYYYYWKNIVSLWFAQQLRYLRNPTHWLSIKCYLEQILFWTEHNRLNIRSRIMVWALPLLCTTGHTTPPSAAPSLWYHILWRQERHLMSKLRFIPSKVQRRRETIFMGEGNFTSIQPRILLSICLSPLLWTCFPLGVSSSHRHGRCRGLVKISFLCLFYVYMCVLFGPHLVWLFIHGDCNACCPTTYMGKNILFSKIVNFMW
jgi:hypothetical protein